MKIGTKKGFTLIELLVVIAIIGILAVALLPTILSAPAKGRDAARKAHISALVTAFEAYNLDKGGYPVYDSTVTTNVGCIDPAAAPGSLLKTYVSGGTVPQDPGFGATNTNAVIPKCATQWQYAWGKIQNVTGKNYWLAAGMEVPTDANSSGADFATNCSGTTTAGTNDCTTSGAGTCVAFNSTATAANKCLFVAVK